MTNVPGDAVPIAIVADRSLRPTEVQIKLCFSPSGSFAISTFVGFAAVPRLGARCLAIVSICAGAA